MHHHEPYDIPSHRKDDVVWSNRAEVRSRLRKTPKCEHCRKHQFRTKVDARGFLALMITRRDRAPESDDYQLRPYRCPWGNGWHIGHDRTVAALLRRGRKQ